ncbi:MAG: 50S ribosomal protein L24 [Armatimonadetes bacterium]|nr:50S ribosomal protein L24 [Armatimonadota bacterium]
MRREREDTRNQPRKRVRLNVGDTVEVISGKDRGERGQITEVLRDEQRVRVAGLALVTQHQKQRGRTRAMQQQAGRIKVPGKIHISNLMLVCPGCAKRTRPRFVVTETAKRRVCRNCGQTIGRSGVEE